MFEKSEDNLIEKAGRIKKSISSDQTKVSSGAVQKVSQQYLDELMRELNQIKAGESHPKGSKEAKARMKEIERQMQLIEQANTGVKTRQDWIPWFREVCTFGNFTLLGVAVAVGIAVALCNPLGLAAVLGGVLAGVAALAVVGIVKGICAAWRYFSSGSQENVNASAAQRELGLDKAANQELASGRGIGIELTSMSGTTPSGVPNVQQQGASNNQTPGAAAARSNRFGNNS